MPYSLWLGITYSQDAFVLFQLQTLSQNRQLAPSSYDAQELTETVMNILGLVAEDDTSDSPVARELSQVHIISPHTLVLGANDIRSYSYLRQKFRLLESTSTPGVDSKLVSTNPASLVRVNDWLEPPWCRCLVSTPRGQTFA